MDSSAIPASAEATTRAMVTFHVTDKANLSTVFTAALDNIIAYSGERNPLLALNKQFKVNVSKIKVNFLHPRILLSQIDEVLRTQPTITFTGLGIIVDSGSELTTLGKLAPTLTRLQMTAGCGMGSRTTVWNELAAFTQLRHFILGDWMELVNLAPLAKCPNLACLDLDCSKVKVDFAPLSQFPTLTSLSLTNLYRGAVTLPAMNYLQTLVVKEWAGSQFPFQIGECPSLHSVELHHCDIETFSVQPIVTSLRLIYCNNLTSLDGLSKLVNLTELVLITINHTRHLADFSPITKCVKLKRLQLVFMNGNQDIDLRNLSELQMVHVRMMGSRIVSPGKLVLPTTHQLTDLALPCGNLPFPHLAVTHRCYLPGATLTSVEGCSPLLEELDISSTKVTRLKYGLNLRRLDIHCTQVKLLPVMEKLEYLNISVSNVEDLTPLVNCPNLRVLIATQTVVTDITPLGQCTRLEELALSGNSYKVPLTDISALAKCTALTRLRLNGYEFLKDITPLSACLNLEWLSLQGCGNIRALPLLTAKLVYLDLLACGGLTDVTTLTNCSSLKVVTLFGCPELRHIAAIGHSPALQEVNFEEGAKFADHLQFILNLVSPTFCKLGPVIVTPTDMLGKIVQESLTSKRITQTVNWARVHNQNLKRKAVPDYDVGAQFLTEENNYARYTQTPN